MALKTTSVCNKRCSYCRGHRRLSNKNYALIISQENVEIGKIFHYYSITVVSVPSALIDSQNDASCNETRGLGHPLNPALVRAPNVAKQQNATPSYNAPNCYSRALNCLIVFQQDSAPAQRARYNVQLLHRQTEFLRYDTIRGQSLLLAEFMPSLSVQAKWSYS